MTKAQLAVLKAALLAKQGELSGRALNREEILIEHSADETDDALRFADRDLAIARCNRASDELRNVRAALRRIDDRTYGVCLRCEEEIGRRRLEALPWAPLCVRCQEIADRDQDLDVESTAHGNRHRPDVLEAA